MVYKAKVLKKYYNRKPVCYKLAQAGVKMLKRTPNAGL